MQKVEIILNKMGAELIEIKPFRKLIYKCKCGNISQNYINNISKPTWKGTCHKCSNKKRGNFNNYVEVMKVFNNKGLELLPNQEYVGNKSKLAFICNFCNKIAHMSLSEIKRGRLCEHCSKIRYKNTCIQTYGVDNFFKSSEFTEKRIATNLLKYGHEHHMQNQEIINKTIRTSYLTKQYTLPKSGKIILCQGYEPRFLDMILKYYDESMIVTEKKDIPKIKYINQDNKNAIYFPDFYIPHENTLIEIKSTWTLKIELLKNKLKYRSCVDNGYTICIYVFDHSKLKSIITYNDNTVSYFYPKNPNLIFIDDNDDLL